MEEEGVGEEGVDEVGGVEGRLIIGNLASNPRWTVNKWVNRVDGGTLVIIQMLQM